MGKVRWALLFLLALDVYRLWGDDGRCSIPLTLRRGVPFVQVAVNGRGPYTFAVDTGTSREAIVSPAVARELSLAVAGRTWLLDLTGRGREAVDEVVLQAVELSGQAFGPVRAMVHDPVPMLGAYDGVLGFSFFRDRILTLDFPRRCLRLEDAGLAEGVDRSVMPYSMPRNVPVVTVTIGDKKVPTQIDSAGGGINFPSSAGDAVEFARGSEVLVRAQSQASTFLLRGGVMKGEVGLGGHVFRQPFVEIGEQLPVGNLGAASLQDFAITFDQGRRLVRFESRRRIHRLVVSQLTEGVRAQSGSSAQVRGGN